MSFAPSRHPTLSALILALASLAAVPAAAREVKRTAERARPVQTVEQELSEPVGTWAAGISPAADCTRARRKLWQAGEGWIVKTITTCR